MDKEVTIYQLNFDYTLPRIIKKLIKIEKKDKLKCEKNGKIEITLVDAWESPHNGDFSDEHEYGYKTFTQAKTALIKFVKKEYCQEIKHINGLKETNI
jgi:hypothetical protein